MVLTDFLRNTHPEWASSDQLWGLHRTLWAEVSRLLIPYRYVLISAEWR